LKKQSPELEINEIRSNMLRILNALDISEKLFTSHLKNGTLKAKISLMKRNVEDSTNEIINNNICEARKIKENARKREQSNAYLTKRRTDWLEKN
jgi:hypothetical protein